MQWQFFPPKTQLTEIIQMTTKVISSDLFLLKIGAKVICSMKAKLQKYISYSSDIAMTSSSGRPSVVYYFFVPVVSLMAANIVLFFLTSLIVNGYKSCWTGRCVTHCAYVFDNMHEKGPRD